MKASRGWLLVVLPAVSTWGMSKTIPVISRHQEMTWRRRWRLQKSAPECTPREEGESLANVLQRVEGRAHGCGDAASASGCEDQAL